MLKMNVSAMREFLSNEDKEVIEENYKEWDLGREYKPKKWNNYLNFWDDSDIEIGIDIYK